MRAEVRVLRRPGRWTPRWPAAGPLRAEIDAAGDAGRGAGRRRRREHPDPARARRLRPGRRSPVQDALDDALAGGDAAALTRLAGAIVGRVAYQVLAGLPDPAPRSATELLPRRALRRRLLRRRLAAVSADRSRSSARPGPGSRRWHWPSPSERVGGEIVNADAMQLYRGMDIGTAKLPVGRAPRHPAPPARRSRRHRDRDRRPLPAGRRRRHRGDRRRGARCRSSSADRCCTSSRCSTNGRSRRPTRRCGPDGSSASPRSASRRCTPNWPRSTPPPRRRSCPPTAAASCGRWRSWS